MPTERSSAHAHKLTGELASESTVIQSQGYSVQHGYDVHGRRNPTSYPGGVEVSYGYDTASRVNALQAKIGDLAKRGHGRGL